MMGESIRAQNKTTHLLVAIEDVMLKMTSDPMYDYLDRHLTNVETHYKDLVSLHKKIEELHIQERNAMENANGQ